jgi:tripartite-type tricarboxylate transporter receptor subunit TctC
LASAGGLAANPSLYPNLSYNPSTDFAPITLFGTSPFVLIANSNVPVKTIKDVIDLAKVKDAKLSYASGGNGTAMHLSGELIKSMAGINLLHVPYRGSAPALMSVMAGETSLAIADIATIEPQMKSSKIKILGVMNKQRSALAPDLPTLAESGLPGFEANGWFAVLAPAGVAQTTVARLNAEIVGVLREAETAEKFAQAGLEPLSSSPEELAQYIKSETIKWSKVIAVSGAKVD